MVCGQPLIFYRDNLNYVDKIELLGNQKVVNGIGFTPFEELKSMCSHSSLSDIIKLLEDKNGPSNVLSGTRKEKMQVSYIS